MKETRKERRIRVRRECAIAQALILIDLADVTRQGLDGFVNHNDRRKRLECLACAVGAIELFVEHAPAKWLNLRTGGQTCIKDVLWYEVADLRTAVSIHGAGLFMCEETCVLHAEPKVNGMVLFAKEHLAWAKKIGRKKRRKGVKP